MAQTATDTAVVPSFDDVLAARERIAPYLKPTALHRYPALDELLGTQTWVKHENHRPIGPSRILGGINLMSNLSKTERRAAVITAPTATPGHSMPMPPGPSGSLRSTVGP